MKKLFLILAVNFLFLASQAYTLPLDILVSGYTDKGIYVQGDLDADSRGRVYGTLFSDKGKIAVNGKIQGKSVEIILDDGCKYKLNIDSWGREDVKF